MFVCLLASHRTDFVWKVTPCGFVANSSLNDEVVLVLLFTIQLGPRKFTKQYKGTHLNILRHTKFSLP